MVMFLLYPTVFSFSHALSHHLIKGAHHESQICCGIHPAKEKGTAYHPEQKQTKCPIHEYEFPLAIENDAEVLSKTKLEFSEYLIQPTTIFISKDLCKKSAPRAPPAVA